MAQHDQVVSPYQKHRDQISTILNSWGMNEDLADQTAEVMAWSDLHGIDSHGISFLTVYHERWKQGRINMNPKPSIIRESPVSTLFNGDNGLGHPLSRRAMQTAIDKAEATGMAISSVRNSVHFGACGFYARMAADRGFIGIATTTTSRKQVAPTRGRKGQFGTDPIAFSAPCLDRNPFLLDMSTTTVASGKIRNKHNEGLKLPFGWVVNKDGQPSDDPLEAVQKGGFLTSLGGSEEGSSYKGYGLAVMVNILSSCLSGSTLITSPMHLKQPFGQDIGHFFMVIDPRMFRDLDDFRSDVSSLCETLRQTEPVDPARPVLVAGDKEWQTAEKRMAEGIPTGRGLLNRIRKIADEHKVPWLLG